MEERREMTVREAGKKGGERGGQTTKERYGTPFYREIGRKGGESTKRNKGVEHYSRIGRIGGKQAHRRKDSAEMD